MADRGSAARRNQPARAVSSQSRAACASTARARQSRRVEWAPADTPHEPIDPYRKNFYVELRHEDRREATRRRLHNLGFSQQRTLGENIKEFQRHFGYPFVNGHLDGVVDDVAAYPTKASSRRRRRDSADGKITGHPVIGG